MTLLQHGMMYANATCFKGNSAGTLGGAIMAIQGGTRVSCNICAFESNKVGTESVVNRSFSASNQFQEGGAVYLGLSARMDANLSSFTANIARFRGAAVAMDDGSSMHARSPKAMTI